LNEREKRLGIVVSSKSKNLGKLLKHNVQTLIKFYEDLKTKNLNKKKMDE